MKKPALAGDRNILRRGATIEFSPAFQGRERLAGMIVRRVATVEDGFFVADATRLETSNAGAQLVCLATKSSFCSILLSEPPIWIATLPAISWDVSNVARTDSNPTTMALMKLFDIDFSPNAFSSKGVRPITRPRRKCSRL